MLTRHAHVSVPIMLGERAASRALKRAGVVRPLPLLLRVALTWAALLGVSGPRRGLHSQGSPVGRIHCSAASQHC